MEFMEAVLKENSKDCPIILNRHNVLGIPYQGPDFTQWHKSDN